MLDPVEEMAADYIRNNRTIDRTVILPVTEIFPLFLEISSLRIHCYLRSPETAYYECNVSLFYSIKVGKMLINLKTT